MGKVNRNLDANKINNISRKKRKRRAKKRRLAFLTLLLIGVTAFAFAYLGNESAVETPEYVIEFGEKYPEAAGFVKNYSKYYGKKLPVDIRNEYKEGEIPLFIQWDKRWGYRDYGNSIIGVSGCGPTCLSMVAVGLSGNPDYDPLYVAKMSYDKGYYIEGQGTSWSLMTDGAAELDINGQAGKISADYIFSNLSADTPMICSMTPGDFTTSGHFIVLAGLDENGKVIVNDPNSPNNSSKAWDANTLVSQMKAIWIFNKE